MRPVRKKPYQEHTFSLSIFHLSLMLTVFSTSRWNTFLDCASLLKSCKLLPHTHYGRASLLGISSQIHDHHNDGKPQEYDLFEMAHLELAHHFFFLHYVGVLKAHRRYHSNFILQETRDIGSTLT